MLNVTGCPPWGALVNVICVPVLGLRGKRLLLKEIFSGNLSPVLRYGDQAVLCGVGSLCKGLLFVVIDLLLLLLQVLLLVIVDLLLLPAWLSPLDDLRGLVSWRWRSRIGALLVCWLDGEASLATWLVLGGGWTASDCRLLLLLLLLLWRSLLFRTIAPSISAPATRWRYTFK